MYGKGDTGFPQRLVCLSSEHVEICYALGAGERVVGVPGTAHRPPEARDKPKVGGFTTFRLDKILELEPDLVLTFSDLRDKASAGERVVDPAEVARRDPQIILASWCGKPVDVEAIRNRPGWEGVSAVKAGRIHEVDGPDILSPGPSVLAGLREIH